MRPISRNSTNRSTSCRNSTARRDPVGVYWRDCCYREGLPRSPWVVAPTMAPARRQAPAEPIVLIVDDDHDARQIYGMFFRSKGWTAFTAVDGRSGIDKAIELKPDAIVLDLAMARVDGWTVLKELRDSSWTADIPVVVVSAL